jgi:peptidoglycan/xylan/chitin deacetylase (PgdA/CDA1 family)
MYHSISQLHSGGHPYYETSTSPAAFQRQMQQLQEAGFRGVSVREALASLFNKQRERLVAITFDDGYCDMYTEALPVLRDFGFSATVYVIAERCQAQRATFKERQCLTVGEIEQLVASGIEIGSHTISHPQLHHLAWVDVEREVRDSKCMIQDRLSLEIKSFCYPYAFPGADSSFRTRFQELLKQSGYDNAVTTIIGTVDYKSDRFALPRLPVNTFDDEPLLRAKLEGGYDWFRTPQYVFKSLKELLVR